MFLYFQSKFLKLFFPWEGSWDPPGYVPDWWLLDLQDRSLSERPAFLLAINSHLSWRTGIQVWEPQFDTICWPTNNQSQYNTWDSKYLIVFQNRKIFHLNFCENFVAITSKFPRQIFITCEISSNFMGRFTKISSFFLLFFSSNKFPPSIYLQDCRFLDLGQFL